jgi:hypothetical protein
MTVIIPHNLAPEEALARIRGMLARLRARHADKISHVREDWSAEGGRFALTVMGMPVQGRIVVQAGQARVDGQLPFAAMFFQGRIEQAIREAAAEALATPAPETSA